MDQSAFMLLLCPVCNMFCPYDWTLLPHILRFFIVLEVPYLLMVSFKCLAATWRFVRLSSILLWCSDSSFFILVACSLLEHNSRYLLIHIAVLTWLCMYTPIIFSNQEPESFHINYISIWMGLFRAHINTVCHVLSHFSAQINTFLY